MFVSDNIASFLMLLIEVTEVKPGHVRMLHDRIASMCEWL